MDTARFHDDLVRIPDSLASLADAVDAGLPGLDTIPAARRILILAMGSSAYAAGNVAREARAGGLDVTVELASTTLLPPPSSDLLVIAISATGASVEVLAAARRYAGTGRLVAITNDTGSPITDLADVVVPLAAGGEQSSVACRTFRHTFVVLAEVLARIGGRFSWSPAGAARSAAHANGSLLASSSTWLAPVSEALLGPSGTFVLAPAERLSSSQQSSLMLREVPRRPAFGSETADWAHVDVYLAKTLDYRSLLYAGSDWDSQALQWMSDRSSTVVSVGRDVAQAVYSVRYPGDEDRMTAALSELLVAELVAWAWYSADPDHAWSTRTAP